MQGVNTCRGRGKPQQEQTGGQRPTPTVERSALPNSYYPRPTCTRQSIHPTHGLS
ncbi:hypothetical protein RSAG8_13917, partial [Rhizoctonia solani AG-8 WAC10335]